IGSALASVGNAVAVAIELRAGFDLAAIADAVIVAVARLEVEIDDVDRSLIGIEALRRAVAGRAGNELSAVERDRHAPAVVRRREAREERVRLLPCSIDALIEIRGAGVLHLLVWLPERRADCDAITL